MESADVGVRGKSTRYHEEMRSEEREETRGWMGGKSHVGWSTASVPWHGDLAGGAQTGGFKDDSGKQASRPGPGDKQHLGTTCFSGGSFVTDKSCTSSQQAEFLSKRTFSVENEVESSMLGLCITEGEKCLAVLIPSWSSLFSICGPCPAHKVLTASFSSSQRLACLLLKGWVRLVRLAKFLAKIHPLKGRDPVPVGAVMMWFLQHSAQPGVSKAEAVPVPCFSHTSISNTTKKLYYPAVKQMEE